MSHQLGDAEEKDGLGDVQKVKPCQEAQQQVEVLLELLPAEHHDRAQVANDPETSHRCL